MRRASRRPPLLTALLLTLVSVVAACGSDRSVFFIGGIPEPPGNTIAGEYTDANSLITTKYIYALTLNGSLVTGTVKTWTRRGPDKPFRPADEWRFDANRQGSFDLR